MISLFRGLLVGILGVGGIGATAYGVNAKPYSDFLKWRNRKIDTKVPVILCDDGYNKYEGFLGTVKVGTKNDRGNGVSFEFKVTDIKKNETYEREWGENVKKPNDWGLWKLAFQGKEIETFFFVEGKPEDTKNRFTTDYGTRKCGKSKIQLKDERKNQDNESGFEDKDIKFEIDKSKCTNGFGSVTCEILFKPDSNLKWSDDFKPTITFY